MRLTAVMWPRRCSIGRRVDDQQVGAMNLMVPLNCEDPVGAGLARDKGIAVCLRYLGGLIAGKPSSHRRFAMLFKVWVSLEFSTGSVLQQERSYPQVASVLR